MSLLERGLIRAAPFADSRLEQTLFGVRFPNPIGLAAGFDKNARALPHWGSLGFGFVECGTITWHGQPGNDKPRMFRIPEEKALINRLGFNNEGASALAGRLKASSSKIPVGINLGKSKITPVNEAAKDYQDSFRALHTYGDYFVVNVSSPNTPGLRSLQEKSALTEILIAMREVDATRPVFVKVAPDLELSALDEVMEVAVECNLTGLIATNTTISRSMLKEDPGQTGGLSGAPLRARSNEVLAHLARQAPPNMILIGVGGISSADDVYEKICLGAHLCQLYTGWIYGGPSMIPRLCEDLANRMEGEGVKDLSEIRGTGL